MTCVEHSWWFPSPCPKCSEQSVSGLSGSEDEVFATSATSASPPLKPSADTPPGVGLEEEQSNVDEHTNDHGSNPADLDTLPDSSPNIPVGPLDDPPYLQRNPDGSWKYPELRPGPPNVFVTGQGWMKPT